MSVPFNDSVYGCSGRPTICRFLISLMMGALGGAVALGIRSLQGRTCTPFTLTPREFQHGL